LVKALSRSKRAVRVVLDATGVYFLDVACDLAAAGIAVMVLNPEGIASLRRSDDAAPQG